MLESRELEMGDVVDVAEEKVIDGNLLEVGHRPVGHADENVVLVLTLIHLLFRILREGHREEAG